MLLVGATRTYSLRTLAPWLGSFRHVRRDGDRQVLLAVGDAGLERGPIARLGAEIVDVEKATLHAVNTERWLHLARLLRDEAPTHEYVLLTDTRDSYFQEHPENKMQVALGSADVLIGAENILYRDSSFNIDPIRQAAPDLAGEFEQRPVLCCGLVYGRTSVLAELAEHTYKTCVERMQDRATGQLLLNGLVDQTALALVLRELGVRHVATGPHDGVFINGAVDWTPTDPQHLARVRQVQPRVQGDEVRTEHGELISVVHQYDRDQALRASVAQRWAHIG